MNVFKNCIAQPHHRRVIFWHKQMLGGVGAGSKQLLQRVVSGIFAQGANPRKAARGAPVVVKAKVFFQIAKRSGCVDGAEVYNGKQHGKRTGGKNDAPDDLQRDRERNIRFNFMQNQTKNDYSGANGKKHPSRNAFHQHF